MNSNVRFRMYKKDIEISTNNIELSNSIGFAIFCNPDNQNILAEISRVANDIKLISIMEKIDLSEVIQIIRNSSDENTSLLNLKEKLGYSDSEADFILNTNLQELMSYDYQLYTKRLKSYKKLLNDFLVE